MWSGHVCLHAIAGKRMDAMHVCVWLYYEKKQLHFGGPLRDLQLSAAAVMCTWCDFTLETCCAWAVFATRVQRRMEDEQQVNCSHRLKMSKEAGRSEQNPAIEQVVETKNIKFRASLTHTQSNHKEQTVPTCVA